ncbi:MAG TPA: DNA polymerase III subunit delta [Candidatus Manganitrophaceae bacterium]|nr:DNA polymerase III subunit delta [Candidatus Manganitrophaceae bacterium]
MTFQEALKSLEQNRFSPLYLISGAEPFLIRRLLDRFREKAIDPGARDFNYDLFQGETLNPEEVIMIAQTFPVCSPRRLIIVQDADLIKDDRELFLGYIENPSPTTVLILTAEKPDMRRKLFVALKKKGAPITCQPLYDNELSRWIAQEGEKRGLRFSEEGLLYLKERLGRELYLLEGEIDKIALYLITEDLPSAASEVSLKIVQEVVGGGRAHSIFELTDAVAEKDLKEAFGLLSSLLDGGEHPLFILTMLNRQWRMMAIAKEALQSGKAESAVGKKLGLPPNLLPPFFRRLKRWRLQEIRSAFDKSLAADAQLKGGIQSASFVMEALLMNLCRPESPTGEVPELIIPFLS